MLRRLGGLMADILVLLGVVLLLVRVLLVLLWGRLLILLGVLVIRRLSWGWLGEGFSGWWVSVLRVVALWGWRWVVVRWPTIWVIWPSRTRMRRPRWWTIMIHMCWRWRKRRLLI